MLIKRVKHFLLYSLLNFFYCFEKLFSWSFQICADKCNSWQRNYNDLWNEKLFFSRYINEIVQKYFSNRLYFCYTSTMFLVALPGLKSRKWNCDAVIMLIKFIHRQVKIRFDLEQIGTKSFSAIFIYIRCTEQHTENLGKSNLAKSFFFWMTSKMAAIIKKILYLNER